MVPPPSGCHIIKTGVPGFPGLPASKDWKLEVLLIFPVRPGTLGEAMLPTSLSLPDFESDSKLKPNLDFKLAGLLLCNLLGLRLIGLWPEASLSAYSLRDPLPLHFLGLSPTTDPWAARPAKAVLIIMLCMACTTSTIVYITYFIF